MINSKDPNDLKEPIKTIAKEIIPIAKNKFGIDVVLLSTYRDSEYQQKIKGTGVISSEPGESVHEYREAFDFGIVHDGKLSFDVKNPIILDKYMKIAKLGEEMGAKSLYRIGDYGHLEKASKETLNLIALVKKKRLNK